MNQVSSTPPAVPPLVLVLVLLLAGRCNSPIIIWGVEASYYSVVNFKIAAARGNSRWISLSIFLSLSLACCLSLILCTSFIIALLLITHSLLICKKNQLPNRLQLRLVSRETHKTYNPQLIQFERSQRW